jgi:hypothetical protein
VRNFIRGLSFGFGLLIADFGTAAIDEYFCHIAKNSFERLIGNFERLNNNAHRSFLPSGSKGNFNVGEGGFGGDGKTGLSTGGLVTGDPDVVFGTEFNFVFGGRLVVPTGGAFDTQLLPSSFSLAPQVFGASVVVPFGSGVPVTAPAGCVVVEQRPSFCGAPGAQPQMPFTET